MNLKVATIKPKAKIVSMTQQEAISLIKAALEESANKVENEMFSPIIATWRHEVRIEKSGVNIANDATISVYTDDPVFWWLDNGVPTRALMPPGFVPKTKVRVYRSSKGSPGLEDPLTYIDKRGNKRKVIRRRPIQGREWTDMMIADATEILKGIFNRKFGSAAAIKTQKK